MDTQNEDLLIIRKARPTETDAVLEFYANMIEGMKGTDFDIRWVYDEHPTNASLIDAVEHDQMYIGVAAGTERPEGTEDAASVEDGVIACAAVVNHEQAPGYEKVAWKVDAPLADIGVVHSVIAHPAYHGRGFATQMMRALIDGSREEGMLSLRLDTFITNVRSRGLYGKLGFCDVGAWPIYYSDLGEIDLEMYEYVL